MWFAYGAMWIAIGVATSVALYLTHEPLCLLALLLGTMVSFSQTRNRRGGEGG